MHVVLAEVDCIMLLGMCQVVVVDFILQ
jgi:hypothetical protein